MVSKNKKRVYLALTHATLQNLEELKKTYNMTGSQVVQFLVNREYQERKK